MSEQIIIEGDCLAVMRGFADKQFDLVLTDPPYGINLGEHGGASETRSGLLVKKGGYDDSVEDFDTNVVPAIKEAIRVSKRAMVFCVPPNMWKLPPPDAIGGIYLSAALGRNKWGWSSFVHCLLYGVAPELNLGAKATGIASNARAEKYDHPVIKPLEWIKWAMDLGSVEGETILDPFMGSGTTLVAAKYLNRNATGIEISPKYCEIARNRLAQQQLF